VRNPLPTQVKGGCIETQVREFSGPLLPKMASSKSVSSCVRAAREPEDGHMSANHQPNRHLIVTLLAVLAVAVTLSSSAGVAAQSTAPVYANLIVPGERVGPVSMGGSVREITRQLGPPSRANRSTFRGPGYTSDEVRHMYSLYLDGSGLGPQCREWLPGHFRGMPDLANSGSNQGGFVASGTHAGVWSTSGDALQRRRRMHAML
jgi:hypothetical protein